MIAAKGSPIQPTLDSLKGKHVGVLLGINPEAYANETGVAKAWMWWPMPTVIWSIPIWLQDVWMPLQDEVAASEGFLKQPAGKDFAFAGSSVKDKNTSVMAPV